MYAVGDIHSHMSPVGDEGGEEELCHVRSGGRSVTHVLSGGWEWQYIHSNPDNASQVASTFAKL